jgi:hypothetical protein
MAGSNVRAQQATTAALESKERSEALAQMHLTKILRGYILQMITGEPSPVTQHTTVAFQHHQHEVVAT